MTDTLYSIHLNVTFSKPNDVLRYGILYDSAIFDLINLSHKFHMPLAQQKPKQDIYYAKSKSTAEVLCRFICRNLTNKQMILELEENKFLILDSIIGFKGYITQKDTNNHTLIICEIKPITKE